MQTMGEMLLRLHRGNDRDFREPIEIGDGDVLGVLDAEAAVAAPVLARDALKCV